MEEGGVRRSGRTRAKSYKAELNKTIEQKFTACQRDRGNSERDEPAGGSSALQGEAHHRRGQPAVRVKDISTEDERVCGLGDDSRLEEDRVGVVGQDGEGEETETEGAFRKSGRKRKRVEKFDPSAGLEELVSPWRGRAKRKEVEGTVGEEKRDAREGREADRSKKEGERTVHVKECGIPLTPVKKRGVGRRQGGGEVVTTDEEQTQPLGDGEGRERGVEQSDEAPSGSSDSDVMVARGGWLQYGRLCEMLPGRKAQIAQLLTLFGEPSSAVCPSLHVYGHTGTGKTLVLQTIMKTLQLPHAYVNCVECYASRLLYETILNQLSGVQPSRSNGYSSYARCDNMAGFVRLLRQVIDSQEYTCQTTYIVLDRAERLREAEPTVLPALLRLAELCGRGVCVVLVTELVWESFLTGTGPLSPLSLHFPNYSKEETLQIMYGDCPSSSPLPFFQTFTNHIWNVFQSVCRDLGELRHLSTLLFPKYQEPVERGEIGSHETRKLWRHIEPYFRGVMSRIYLRELSSSQWERVQSTSGDRRMAEDLSAPCAPLELPHYCKFLLIAAYLASYNPAKTDKRFFAKQKQSRGRRSRRQPQKEKPNYQLLGPRMFPLNRLMAIFYSIIEEPVTPIADIYSQISSLVTLQLLAQASTRDSIDSAKYKCLVTLDFIRQVARSVGFDIVQYLYDFA